MPMMARQYSKAATGLGRSLWRRMLPVGGAADARLLRGGTGFNPLHVLRPPPTPSLVRNVGFGLEDFMSAWRKGKLQSRGVLLSGISQGSENLIGSTVYAVSRATSHFSKTAYKGFVAFTYDEQAASKLDERERQLGLHGEGVLNGFLEERDSALRSFQVWLDSYNGRHRRCCA